MLKFIKQLTLALILLSICLQARVSFAKRTPPPEIADIVLGGIIYHLDAYKEEDKLGNLTYNFVCLLVAKKNEKIIWSKVVYEYKLDPQMELDAQEIYPVKFSYEPSKIPSPFGSKNYPAKWFTIETEEGKIFTIQNK